MIRVFSHRDCLAHQAPAGYPERAERVSAILGHLADCGEDVHWAEDHPALAEVLEAVHGRSYVDRFRRAVARGDGLLDSADNPLSPGTYRAAQAAVTACLAAADWVVAGERRRGLAVVRPPGHHAERHLAMGFCYFANVFSSAMYLRRQHGMRRLAIVDFDVHHGNGTQSLSEEDPEIFFVSLHQYPFYPGSGAADEVGVGLGRGTVLNLPLSAGSTDADYSAAFDRLAAAVEEFSPQVLLVSAGFDAWQGDPLGGMRVSSTAYADWGARIAALADRCCAGRVLSVFEGGYDLAALPGLVSEYLAGLAASAARAPSSRLDGLRPRLVDPGEEQAGEPREAKP